MDSQHIPQSLFYAQHGKGGTWVDAQWSAALTDDATGEILATAINPNDGQPTDWAMIAIRLNRAFLATLRQLAGIDAPLPADQARAEAAYWQECVQTAANMLAETRDVAFSPGPVEQYLRQTLIAAPPSIPSTPSDADFAFTREQLERVLLDAIAMFIEYRDVHGKSEQDAPHYAAREIEQGLDADIELASRGEYQSPKRSTSVPSISSTDCYDCRTLTQRVAGLEISLQEDAATLGQHARRIDEVRERLDDWVLAQMPHRDARLATIEQRLSALESTKPQPLSAVDALRQQIANIQARDPDGLKMTWSEIALACALIADEALEVHDGTPTQA